MSERKLPGLGRFEDLAGRDRIPTLTEIAIPPREQPSDAGHGNAADERKPPAAQATGESRRYEWTPHAELPAALAQTAQPEPAPTSLRPRPKFDENDIEEMTDRVLDALAPILREHIAVALAQLIDERLERER